MITRERFRDLLSRLLAEIDRTRSFSEAVGRFCPSDHAPASMNDGFIVLSVDLLKDLCGGDRDDWIGYWLWETDRGSKSHLKAHRGDGSEIPLSTPDDLYDILAETVKG
jgi:hypothetical protein